jgi:Ras-related C3 botulinum toxin substrate 1
VLLKWKPEIEKFIPDVPIVLISTKIDLRNNLKKEDELKFVTTEMGRSMALRINASSFFETSALNSYHINFVPFCIDVIFGKIK